MDSYVIKLPEKINAEIAQTVFLLFSKEYEKSFSLETKKIVFDFSKCKIISPVGLIFICMWRDRLIEKGKETFYRRSRPETNNFLQKMHLIPPVDKYEENSIQQTFFYGIHRCNDTLECREAHKEIVSKVVAKDEVSEETYCAVDYMINEIWDNAGVHGYGCYATQSYPKPVYICALEKDDYYEVCIGDSGQGIYNSLRKNNPKIKNCNKKDAIRAAIQDGISGHPNGSPGFGLYSAAEFIRGGHGVLHIWSSGCYLAVSAKKDRICNSCINEGTLVTFVINKNAVLPFTETLNARGTYKQSTQEYIEDMIGGLFDEQ